MNIKNVFLLSALTLGSANTFSASLGILDLSTGSAGFSNTPIVGVFTDTMTFALTASSIANGSLTSAVNGNQDVDFTSIQLSGPSGLFSFSQGLFDPFETWSLPAAGPSLAAGLYTLSVNGVNSAGRGSYGGNFAVTSTATGAVGGVMPAVNLGTLDLSTGSAGFSNTPVAGIFTDIMTFALTTLSIANGSLTSAVNGNQDVDFTSIQLSGPSGLFSFSQGLFDPVETWSLPAAGPSLAAGLYTLSVNGVNSAGRGSYGGNFAVTSLTPSVNGVPEPDTYALMLAGLGILAFAGRRKAESGLKTAGK